MRSSPTLCFTKRISHSWLTAPKKFWMSASTTQFTFRLSIATDRAIQRVVRPSSGPKPVGETAEVAFIDRIEYQHGRALDDLILQGR